MYPPPDEAETRRLRHDLRGAVNEMRLCVEVLRAETDTDAALEWVDMIERAADRAGELLSKLTPEE